MTVLSLTQVYVHSKQNATLLAPGIANIHLGSTELGHPNFRITGIHGVHGIPQNPTSSVPKKHTRLENARLDGQGDVHGIRAFQVIPAVVTSAAVIDGGRRKRHGGANSSR